MQVVLGMRRVKDNLMRIGLAFVQGLPSMVQRQVMPERPKSWVNPYKLKSNCLTIQIYIMFSHGRLQMTVIDSFYKDSNTFWLLSGTMEMGINVYAFPKEVSGGYTRISKNPSSSVTSSSIFKQK